MKISLGICAPLLGACLTATLLRPSQAFRTGAGGCAGEGPAVGASHLDYVDPTSGTATFDDRIGATGPIPSNVFFIDGVAIQASSAPIELAAGAIHTYEIRAPVDSGVVNPYRGFLVRLDAQSGVGAAISGNGELTQVAAVCEEPAIGVTHVNNDNKTTTDGTFVYDEAGDVFMDVNIVFLNRDDAAYFPFKGVSLFAHSTYTLRFTPQPSVTEMPITPMPVTPAPTLMPVTAPTPMPVPAPTPMPVMTEPTFPPVVPGTNPVCYLCGGPEFIISNPAAILPISPNQIPPGSIPPEYEDLPLSCENLQFAGDNGLVDPSLCSLTGLVQNIIDSTCGCVEGDIPAPPTAVPPTAAPVAPTRK